MRAPSPAVALAACLLIIVPLPAQDTPDLKALLKVYRSHGLPIPRLDAPLVVVDTPMEKDTLAFKMPEPAGEGLVVIMRGTALVTAHAAKTREVKPDPALADRTRPPWGGAPFEEDVDLATALQCLARGYDDLAARVAMRREDHAGRMRKHTVAEVHRIAWAYWQRQAAVPGSDRKEIARRMAAIEATGVLSDREKRWSRGMAATVQPTSSKPGSPEALIDALTELHGFPFADRDGENGVWRGSSFHMELDPRYRALLERGFEAVPALLAAMDDPRVTRTISRAMGNKKDDLILVGDVVRTILGDLARPGTRRRSGPGRASWGRAPTKAWLKTWWEKAKAEGEEKYLVRHVLVPGQWPNQTALDIVALRHPERLIPIYEALLDERHDMQSYPIIDRFRKSPLVDFDAKVKALLAGARHEVWEHRRAAMFALRALAPEKLPALVRHSLGLMPKTPDIEYWRSGATALAQLVLHADDDATWQLFVETAKKADVGMRCQYLQGLMYVHRPTESGARKRIDFLTKFLDDRTVRDKSHPLYAGPCAAMNFPTISVRDYATWQLGHCFKLGLHPKPKWTMEQWADLHRRVQAKLSRK